MLARHYLEENEGGSAGETDEARAEEATGPQQGQTWGAPWYGPGLSAAEKNMFHAIMDQEASGHDVAMAEAGILPSAKLEEPEDETEMTDKRESPQRSRQRRFQDLLAKLNKPAEERYVKLVSEWVDPETGASQPDPTWTVLEMFA
jgi:hypothetical protein